MKKIYLILIVTIILVQSYSQKVLNEETGKNFTLSQPLENSQSYEYTASEYTKMVADEETGFEYSPDVGQYFQAKTDPLLVFPPEENEFGGPNPGDTGVVGTLPGNFSVSPTGTAIYTIPIELPQGLNGMTPAEIAEINLKLGRNKLLKLIRKRAEKIHHSRR